MRERMLREHDTYQARESAVISRRVFLVTVLTLAVLLAAAVGAGGFYFKKYQDINKSPGVSAQNELERIVDKISKLYDLPDGDATMARVDDATKLQDQEFFKSAKEGDYVVIFADSKLAILYREQSNKIINVGPVDVNLENNQESASKQQ